MAGMSNAVDGPNFPYLAHGMVMSTCGLVQPWLTRTPKLKKYITGRPTRLGNTDEKDFFNCLFLMTGRREGGWWERAARTQSATTMGTLRWVKHAALRGGRTPKGIGPAPDTGQTSQSNTNRMPCQDHYTALRRFSQQD